MVAEDHRTLTSDLNRFYILKRPDCPGRWSVGVRLREFSAPGPQDPRTHELMKSYNSSHCETSLSSLLESYNSSFQVLLQNYSRLHLPHVRRRLEQRLKELFGAPNKAHLDFPNSASGPHCRFAARKTMTGIPSTLSFATDV